MGHQPCPAGGRGDGSAPRPAARAAQVGHQLQVHDVGRRAARATRQASATAYADVGEIEAAALRLATRAVFNSRMSKSGPAAGRR